MGGSQTSQHCIIQNKEPNNAETFTPASKNLQDACRSCAGDERRSRIPYELAVDKLVSITQVQALYVLDHTNQLIRAKQVVLVDVRVAAIRTRP